MQRPLSSVDVVIAFAELGTTAFRELRSGQDGDRGLALFWLLEEGERHFGSKIYHSWILDASCKAVKALNAQFWIPNGLMLDPRMALCGEARSPHPPAEGLCIP
jgi:hypothetical protein